MATTVGQHSVAAFTSPVNGTTPIDANTVRGNDNTVRVAYVDHDADPGIHVQSSSLASRPAAGTAGRKWITEDSGVYTLWFDDGTNWHPVSSENVALTVLAGENLVKGDVVKVTGWNNGQDLPEVVKVSSASDVAFAIMTAAVSSGSMGYATNTGIVQDVNTNSFAVGTILYPNTSGGFTSTKPTSGNYQTVAFVLRQNANNGVIFVEFSSPRIVERSDNTASTIVLRDASGNFSAGTITAGALTSTGLVTFASLKGTGATTVTNILDEDNMASDSATALATQQSIKAYVDAQVATVDTLAEVLANGNTTGANNIIVTAGQKVTTDTIDETTAAAGVTIDSVLLKDDVVNATDIEVDTISANNGTLAVTLGSTGVATIAQQPILSSLTASQAVFTDSSKGLVSNAITGTGNVVMSASPTLTGTVTAATLNATTLGGTLSTAAQPNVTSLGTLSSLAVTGNLTLGADVVLSRGAADRLDLASGDSLNVVSGTYKIAGTDVLSSNTLGSGVTASSLTSVGTLTSLTVSGNANFDSGTLYVDAVNNRVGVGTASPQVAFTVSNNGSAAHAVRLYDTGANASYLALTASNTDTALIASGTSAVPMDFYTGGSVRMRLDASGNLGLGVTPSAWSGTAFQLKGNAYIASTTQVLEIAGNAFWDGTNWKYVTSSQNAERYAQVFGEHRFFTAPSGTAGNNITFTQAMTLDASGNLIVGDTSNDYGSAGRGVIEVNGSSEAFYGLKTGGVGRGFIAHTGTHLLVHNASNGQIEFATNATERARITSGGEFCVGTQTASGLVTFEKTTETTPVVVIKNPQYSIDAWATNTSGDNIWVRFFTETAATQRGSITYNRTGGLVAYNTTSDYRAKDILGPIENAGETIDALQVYMGKMHEATIARPMLIAHEAQAVTPYAVTGEKDAVREESYEVTPAEKDEDGNVIAEAVMGVREVPVYQQIDHSAYVPLLIAEIQSLRSRVAALEA